jgi:hypothetical protein
MLWWRPAALVATPRPHWRRYTISSSKRCSRTHLQVHRWVAPVDRRHNAPFPFSPSLNSTFRVNIGLICMLTLEFRIVLFPSGIRTIRKIWCSDTRLSIQWILPAPGFIHPAFQDVRTFCNGNIGSDKVACYRLFGISLVKRVKTGLLAKSEQQ